MAWCDYKNRKYFVQLLRKLHFERLIEFTSGLLKVELLPTGRKYVGELLKIDRQNDHLAINDSHSVPLNLHTTP